MIESEKLSYSRVYELIKKVSDSYERGLSQAIEQIEELKKEKHENQIMLKQLKALETRNRKSPLSKDEIDTQLKALLNVDMPHHTDAKGIKKRTVVSGSTKKTHVSKTSNR